MATGDIKIIDSGAQPLKTRKWPTDAGTSNILAGEPVKQTSSGSQYAALCVDAELSTDTVFYGIAKKNSTHTSTADGYVEVYVPLPGVVYSGKATTSANFDTQSEIDALIGDRVSFDHDAGANSFTVDENEGDSNARVMRIVGGDPTTKEVHFVVDGGWFARESVNPS